MYRVGWPDHQVNIHVTCAKLCLIVINDDGKRKKPITASLHHTQPAELGFHFLLEHPDKVAVSY